jgi:U3 small nucleolar RNA-associated protein 19
MLEAELSKEIKKVPIIEFEIPKKIFMEHDMASGLDNSLLVETITFS